MKKIINILMKEADRAYKRNEIPVGCVIVKNQKIISKAHNKKQKTHRCIDHAEIIAITKASKKKKDWRLDDCDLYVTLEPCDMCMEVIRQSRIKNVYYLIESNFVNEKNKIINKKIIESDDTIKKTYKIKLKSFFDNKR